MRSLRKRTYLFFILPGFILYTLIVIYPILSALPYSFTRWNGIGEAEFCGLQNYIDLFSGSEVSKEFFNAIFNNLKFIALVMLVSNPLAFLIAYIFFRKLPGGNFYKAVIFSPHLINAIVIGFMVTLFFDPNLGLLGIVMRGLGFEEFRTISFVGNPKYAIFYVFIVNTWKGIGYSVLLFLANFNTIPQELGEAAVIDGASGFRCLISVYLPQMIPSITNVTVLSYIWGITLFEIPYVIGGPNGGVGKSSDFLALFFYRNTFNSTNVSNSFGRGTAISAVMFVLIAVGAIAQLWLMKKMEKD